MPSKNEVKLYIPNGIYHLYNRGVDKREIFSDEQDYGVFLSYLKTYLLPKNEKDLREQLTSSKLSAFEKDKIIKLLRMNNFSENLILMTYALMPNHFHLLIQQKSAITINKFMNSLITRYSMYFNKKYRRIGPLFQGVYKAVIVEKDEQLLYLSRYIHYQALYNVSGQVLQKSFPSSYLNYVGKIKQNWIKSEKILSYFHSLKDSTNSYKLFVENQYNDSLKIIEERTLDD